MLLSNCEAGGGSGCEAGGGGSARQWSRNGGGRGLCCGLWL